MNAIAVEEVTKTYRIGVGRARFREMMPWPVDRAIKAAFPRWWARDTFNALEECSLTVARGSSVGMIGHNGAGKTTLLRVIAGVTAPSTGRVTVSGHVGALLDVLVGFHPELTGRENIYLLGAMHGLGRRTMAARVDRILEFAEIHEMIDTPLKRYSAGMGARLGFAIVIALDPEILLVDEVLSVGDASFQRKCIRWMDEFRAQGGTLFFVSHNMGLVRNMTERTVWLDHGRVMADGPTSSVLAKYARAMEHRDAGPLMRVRGVSVKHAVRDGMRRWGGGGARLEEVHLDDSAENGSSLDIAVTYEALALDRAIFCVGFVNESGAEVGAAVSSLVPLHRGKGAVRCSIHPLPFRSGIYFPVVAILSPDGQVRDRWQLERAVVVERDGEIELEDAVGRVSVDIASVWSDGAVS